MVGTSGEVTNASVFEAGGSSGRCVRSFRTVNVASEIKQSSERSTVPLTALALACVPQLLQTTAHLFGRPAVACCFENIVGDKLVAHGEATECACGPRVDWSVAFKT